MELEAIAEVEADQVCVISSVSPVIRPVENQVAAQKHVERLSCADRDRRIDTALGGRQIEPRCSLQVSSKPRGRSVTIVRLLLEAAVYDINGGLRRSFERAQTRRLLPDLSQYIFHCAYKRRTSGEHGFEEFLEVKAVIGYAVA